MNSENIIMTKAEREAMLERVEVLQKVKTLLLIPRLYMATTQQVADFFEVEIVAVQKCYSEIKELDGNGVKTYKAAELDGLLGQDVQAVDAKGKRIFCVGDDFYFDATYSGTKFFPPRATLNALIRAIAAAAFDHKYSLAWDKFYRELKYRTGIHISSRAESKSGRLILDGVREDEWSRLLKVAASLCYDYCVDVVYATNKETVAKYSLDTIETELGVRRNRGTVTKKVAESDRKGAEQSA